MKLLLILITFLPVILLAQKPKQDGDDTMPRTVNNPIDRQYLINLHTLTSSMGNDKCTKAAETHITDNGGYTTTIVFRHGITSADTIYKEALPRLKGDPIEKIETLKPYKLTVATAEEIVATGPVAIPDALKEIPIIDNTPPIEKIATSALHKLSDIAVEETLALTPVMINEPTFDEVATTEPSKLPDTALTDSAYPANNNETETPVTTMHLSHDGYTLLEKLEGYSPELYNLHDGGYTIGFGFAVAYKDGDKWAKGITWAGAENMIQQKVQAYEDQVKTYINVPLTQREFDALTMLAYNLGGFSKATSVINDINNQADAARLQSDWKRFVHSKAPNVARGLMNRRKDELEVRQLSNYQPNRKLLIFKNKK